ncbi:hypothetical protein AGABI1DRAFT_43824 [Agaricus bisporus var. burnettii JB137-S8]|uniref:FAD dependent oxidoreductase domain-containing protein n=1 Tax=Agaricus bisporus var. burnettii (strain JB137-S8 / ATCC MYA-4627 / FGSC 10392) TaxID=597362 RepID=K5WPH2_AGABU|nr:uncharacterized protein AGABI1DRAFT_43824 [Agaricus bisporus var. burnettii JB137-S8]EKM77231.1 hypothetical protein AGABI1DRAFT_43824 [Agaricus bisporus var. burnettii JB137-S8]
MPKHSRLFTYSFLFLTLSSSNSQLLNPQAPWSLSNYSRPPWLTLPVTNPTKSFWIDKPGVNPLAREGSTGTLGFGDEDVDVCVIGSGITGISAVYHLQRLLDAQGIDKKVVVLEAREFCSGATGRNGGHLTRNFFHDFGSRESHYGTENAKKSYLIEEHVATSIVNIIHSHGLVDAVDLVQGDHITLFFEDEEARLALRDYKDAQAHGLDLTGVEFLDRGAMMERYGVDYPGVFFPSHNLWPLKLVTLLYDSSLSRSSSKVKLHTLTPVTSVLPSTLEGHTFPQRESKWTVETPRGSLNCNNIIHATNAYASYLLPQYQDQIIPTRGQMAALRAKSSLDRLLHHSWGANWGYEYWFPRPEEISDSVETRNPPLVLLGGGRDTAGPMQEQYTMDDSVISEKVSKTLNRFLPELWNGTDLFEEGREPEMEWTGIMGFTSNGEPIVGPIPELDGQYIAAGFTGHGMPRAFAAAEAVAGMIVAKLTNKEWKAPEWLPEHYLTSWNY